MPLALRLEFTPLEFETAIDLSLDSFLELLEFTPLEFETLGIEK